MNKNEQFYDKQYEYMDQIFDAKVEAYHHDKVELVEKNGLKIDLNILELGSGNGEFAVAAAMHGNHVSAVEIIPRAISKMFELAKENNVTRRIKAHQDSFYTILLADKFDTICYWDGFGVGTDADQQLLLHNIDYWLKPDGTVFIDVFAPAYWAKTAGQFMELSKTVCRQYDFVIDTNRMLDTWWLTENPDEKSNNRCAVMK